MPLTISGVPCPHAWPGKAVAQVRFRGPGWADSKPLSPPPLQGFSSPRAPVWCELAGGCKTAGFSSDATASRPYPPPRRCSWPGCRGHRVRVWMQGLAGHQGPWWYRANTRHMCEHLLKCVNLCACVPVCELMYTHPCICACMAVCELVHILVCELVHVRPCV